MLKKGYWERGVDLDDTKVFEHITPKAGLDWSELAARVAQGHHNDDQDGYTVEKRAPTNNVLKAM